MGDSNLTESIAFPAGNGDDPANFRVTVFGDNWQDEQVAEKDGALVAFTSTETGMPSGGFAVDGIAGWLALAPGGESTDGVNRPLTYEWLDNLGQVKAEYVYAGNTIGVADIIADADVATGMPSGGYYEDLA